MHSRSLRLRLFWLFPLLASLTWSQVVPPTIPSTLKQPANGISVGSPKVYDNRTLTLMLEELQTNLRSTQFVDRATVAASVDKLQGSRSREVVSNTTISTLPIPGVTTTVANVSSATPSTTTNSTTTEPQITPSAPTVPTGPPLTGFTPNYGQNAADLLNDQVSLTYQIFNLRMLLERSLSDRVHAADPRLQAVLGFNISLDPPLVAKDAVAVVEISLISDPYSREELSLVALMPQEKTYNASSLSTKSNAFGGSAVVDVFQIGHSQRRSEQVFYLYRDNDTIAFEKMDNDSGQLVFGWAFRPVLGRRSVSPGPRQMFAVVALPEEDKRGKSRNLVARVKTYWRKYDRDTMTSFRSGDDNRRTRFLHGITMGLARPLIFDAKTYDLSENYPFTVLSTEDYQDRLKPVINTIAWTPVGAKAALVTIAGKNFYSGTQVAIGDKTQRTPDDGLVIKSNAMMELIVPLEHLTNPAAIIGRYGPAHPLQEASPPPLSVILGTHSLGPSLSGYRRLAIKLVGPPPLPAHPVVPLPANPPPPPIGSPLTIVQLPKRNNSTITPIIAVNSTALPFPYSMVEVKADPNIPGDVDGVLIEVQVPDALIGAAGTTFKVTWPFFGPDWTLVERFYEPISAFQVTRLTKGSVLITTREKRGFTLLPSNLPPTTTPYHWSLFANGSSIALKNPNFPGGDAQSYAISTHAVSVTLANDGAIPDRIALISPEAATFMVDVPKLAPEPPSPPSEIKENDVVWLSLPVDDTTKIGSVMLGQATLLTRPTKTTKAIEVLLDRGVTAHSGDLDIVILDTQNPAKPLKTVRVRVVTRNAKTEQKS